MLDQGGQKLDHGGSNVVIGEAKEQNEVLERFLWQRDSELHRLMTQPTESIQLI
jgi:hypothetical protein